MACSELKHLKEIWPLLCLNKWKGWVTAGEIKQTEKAFHILQWKSLSKDSCPSCRKATIPDVSFVPWPRTGVKSQSRTRNGIFSWEEISSLFNFESTKSCTFISLSSLIWHLGLMQYAELLAKVDRDLTFLTINLWDAERRAPYITEDWNWCVPGWRELCMAWHWKFWSRAWGRQVTSYQLTLKHVCLVFLILSISQVSMSYKQATNG